MIRICGAAVSFLLLAAFFESSESISKDTKCSDTSFGSSTSPCAEDLENDDAPSVTASPTRYSTLETPTGDASDQTSRLSRIRLGTFMALMFAAGRALFAWLSRSLPIAQKDDAKQVGAASDVTTYLVAPVALLSASDQVAIEHAIGSSWAGAENSHPEWGVHWAMGPEMAAFENPSRQKVCRFVGAMCCYRTLQKGFCLGVWSGGDALKAVLLARRCTEQTTADDLASKGLLEIIPNHMEAAKLCTTVRHTALNAASTKFDDLRKDTPHLYIEALAVIPAERGNGLSSKLMQAIHALADAEKLPCCVDCTEKLIPFYVRFGYEEVTRLEVEVPEDTGDDQLLDKSDFLGASLASVWMRRPVGKTS